MTPLVAVYDACVLRPAPLRDLLVRVALAGLVRAHWTDQIRDEWTRAVLANRPTLAPADIERTRRLLDAHVPDARVTGYEGRIPLLALPDPDDRHVLAAAVHRRASIVVALNLSRFPAERLAPHAVEAVHPDTLVLRLFADEPFAVCEAVRRQRLALKSPPKSVDEFLPVLTRCGMWRTVEALRTMPDSL